MACERQQEPADAPARPKPHSHCQYEAWYEPPAARRPLLRRNARQCGLHVRLNAATDQLSTTAPTPCLLPTASVLGTRRACKCWLTPTACAHARRDSCNPAARRMHVTLHAKSVLMQSRASPLSRGILQAALQLKSLQDRGVSFAIRKGHNALQAPPAGCPDYIYPGPERRACP